MSERVSSFRIKDGRLVELEWDGGMVHETAQTAKDALSLHPNSTISMRTVGQNSVVLRWLLAEDGLVRDKGRRKYEGEGNC